MASAPEAVEHKQMTETASSKEKTPPRAIGILGAGNWGTVLAILAAKQVAHVYLYDRSADRVREMTQARENKRYLPGIKLASQIEITNDLEKVFKECQLVLPVIPSSVFRSFTKQYAVYTRGDHFLVHGTKGLEPNTHKRMSEILLEETNCLRVGALSGPNLAMELAQGHPGATVISSRFHEVIEACQAAFSSQQLRVYGNHDLVGVEWAGSLKNILAVAAGMLQQLGFGQNALAMVLTRGIAEMSRLITAMGAHSTTLLGLAGIGDVIATCSSPLSRNFRAGQMLARGMQPAQIEKELAMAVEGLNTIKVAVELSNQKRIYLPITQALWQIAFNGKSVEEALRELMELPASLEFTLN
jgi:glycerol-3-phosphate dehydrogenase (NAD(P)+)